MAVVRNIRYSMKLSIVLALLLFYVSCSLDPIAGGTTTETTNGITAILLNSDGSAAKDVTVQIRPKNFLPDPDNPIDSTMCQTTKTNDGGSFSFYFNNPDTGIYTISAINPDSTEGIIISDISLPFIYRDVEYDTVMLDLYSRTMMETGNCSGMHRDGTSPTNKIVVRFYGTALYFVIDPGESFIIRGLPPAEYIVHTSFTESSETRIDTIVIFSNSTTYLPGQPLVDSLNFIGAKKIGFNTTDQGAYIFDDISIFPLLIRLNSNNPQDALIFERTKQPGSIRFYDDNDDVLLYEIEEWDTLASPKHAEIWISIPIIYGNNNSHYIELSYGAELPDGQSQYRIFDRDYGYSSTWHLNETTDTIIYDATAHQYNGTKVSALEPASVLGFIGHAQQFDGTDDWVDLGRDINYLSSVQSFTVMAWVNLQSYKGDIIRISGGDDRYSRAFISVDSSGHVVAGGNAIDTPSVADKNVSTVSTLELNRWYHLGCVLSYRDNQIEIYINGIKAATTTTGTILFELSQTPNTDSKYAALGSHFTGASGFSQCIIDECRIYRGSRNSSWIRLCYETQRLNSPFFQ